MIIFITSCFKRYVGIRYMCKNSRTDKKPPNNYPFYRRKRSLYFFRNECIKQKAKGNDNREREKGEKKEKSHAKPILASNK